MQKGISLNPNRNHLYVIQICIGRRVKSGKEKCLPPELEEVGENLREKVGLFAAYSVSDFLLNPMSVA